MNRGFPSDFFFPQKEQTGSKSEPEPGRFQDTTPACVHPIRQTLARRAWRPMYDSQA
jgi:hypothetical protein